MPYFAQIDASGTVVQVIRLYEEDAPGPALEVSEPLGQVFIAETLRLPGTWVQTSYNGTFRKQYAGIGYRYLSDVDVFVAPQPFPSWVLNATHDWQPPTPMPTEGGPWEWDEDTLSWIEIPAE